MSAKSPPPAPKIGAGHVGAMWRAGLKELGQVMAATKDSIQPVEEIGLVGTALPQDIYESRHQRETELQHNIEIEM